MCWRIGEGLPCYWAAILAESARLIYVRICAVWSRRPKGAEESRTAAGAAGGSRRRQQAGRHGRGLLRASLYIAQKGGGRPACRNGSTAERQAERQAERRGRAAGGTAGGRAKRPPIILLFIIIIYIIH